jgi:hypothetical protein
MKLTRALSAPVERYVMDVDLGTIRVSASSREYALEASLVLASSLLTIAMLGVYAAVHAVAGDSDAAGARLLDGAAAGLIFAGIALIALHLVRYLVWYRRRQPRRQGEPPGEIDDRRPPAMSTDWDFALALAIVALAALTG